MTNYIIKVAWRLAAELSGGASNNKELFQRGSKLHSVPPKCVTKVASPSKAHTVVPSSFAGVEGHTKIRSIIALSTNMVILEAE